MDHPKPLDTTNVVKLLEFAYWKLVDSDDYLMHEHGELCYTTPEICTVLVADQIGRRLAPLLIQQEDTSG